MSDKITKTRAALFAADEALEAALRAQHPYLEHLGDVRYNPGHDNEATAAARDAYHTASDAYINAVHFGDPERMTRADYAEQAEWQAAEDARNVVGGQVEP